MLEHWNNIGKRRKRGKLTRMPGRYAWNVWNVWCTDVEQAGMFTMFTIMKTFDQMLKGIKYETH